MGGRSFNAWYARAASNIQKHVDELKNIESRNETPASYAKILEERLKASHDDTVLNAEIPTVRLKGAAYGKAKAKQAEVEEAGDNPVYVANSKRYSGMKVTKLNQMTCCLPVLFGFPRVVVDEITYVKDKHATAILSLSSPIRWVLSGTTPLEDFADVRLLASFIGIQLGIEDDAVGVLRHDHIQRIRKDRTRKFSQLLISLAFQANSP